MVTEDVKKFIENRGGKLDPNWVYLNSTEKFSVSCDQGHLWLTCWNVIQSNHWCPKCSRQKIDEKRIVKNNYDEEVKKFIENKGGKLDPNWKYVNNHEKFDVECIKGHRWQVSWGNLKLRNSWCPYCNKHTVDEKFALDFIENKGGKVSEDWVYVDAKIKFDLECSQGHKFRSCWDKIRANHWCPYCFGNNKLEEDKVKNLINLKGGKLDSDWKYISSFSKFWVTCSKGHRWQAIWGNLRENHWCPHCKETKLENEFRNVMERIFSVPFPKIKPEWLKNPTTQRLLELDGYNQGKKLAFEYQGPYHYDKSWFSKIKDVKIQQRRDVIKSDLCQKNKVILIVMPFWVSKKDWEIEITNQIKGVNYV